MKKHKRLLALSLLFSLAMFAVAKRMADKRPRFFARVPCVMGLTFSSNGRKLFLQRDLESGQILDISSKSLEEPQYADISNPLFFSFDDREIFQVFTSGCRRDEENDSCSTILTPTKVYIQHFNNRSCHILSPGSNFYGVRLQNNELTCEASKETLRINVTDGHLLARIPHRRLLKNAVLVPDGRTLWTLQGNKYCFWDLDTQKQLWAWTNSRPVQFSFDGRLLLTWEGHAITAYDIRTGAEQWRVRGPEDAMFAISPKGDLIYEVRPDTDVLFEQIWIWPV